MGARPIPRLPDLVASLLAGAGSRAENLVENGDFDDDLTHWTPLRSLEDSYVEHEELGFDDDFDTNKGSLRIFEGRNTGFNNFNDARQCVNLPALPETEPLAFEAYAWAATAGGDGAGVVAEVITWQYAGPDCTGTILDEVRGAVAARGLTTLTEGPHGLARWSLVQWEIYPPDGGGSSSVLIALQLVKRLPNDDAAGGFDDVYLGETREPACSRTTNQTLTHCLRRDQFEVRADWQTTGASGHARAVPLTDDTGAFWFFSPNNLEMIVKVLNGCAINDRYWVFAGGLTDVNVTLTVADYRTGVTKTYVNPLGETFTPFQDTSAFATCP